MAHLFVQNCLLGMSSSMWKFGRNWPTHFKNGDLQPIYSI